MGDQEEFDIPALKAKLLESLGPESGIYPVLVEQQFPHILARVAALWGKDEWDCYFDILAAFGDNMLDINHIGLLFTPEHSAAMVSQPMFILAVDGFSSIVGDPAFTDPFAHPINYAGILHYLTYHVREKHTLRMEEAIRKMTSMAATHFGLRGRGMVQAGYYADLVVFDFNALDDVSTLEKPAAYVRGVEHVLRVDDAQAPVAGEEESPLLVLPAFERRRRCAAVVVHLHRPAR